MTDTTIIKLTAAEIAAKIASGELTAVEVTEAHLARIEAVDEKVHAFLHVDREGALAQARAVDAKRARGREARPAGRCPARAQGHLHHRGHPDHRRLEDPRGLDPAVRRDRSPSG